MVFSMLLLLRKKIKRNLTSRGNIGKVPAILTLAPHVDRAVLAQCAAVEPFRQLYQTEKKEEYKPSKVVALLSRIKGYGVDAAVAVDGALRVAETISLISVGV